MTTKRHYIEYKGRESSRISESSITFLNRKEFKNLYGEIIYIIANNLERLFKKKTKLEQHVEFLQQCKQHDLIPKGLTLKNTTKSMKNDKVLKSTMYKIRNNVLEDQQKQLRYIRININTQLSILNLYLRKDKPLRNPEEDLKWINRYTGKFEENLINKHNHKLERLKSQQERERENREQRTTTTDIPNRIREQVDKNPTNVVNMSTVRLGQNHLNLLAKGLKFVPTPRNINTVTHIVNCESALSSTPPTIKKAAIAEVTTFIEKWKKPRRTNMSAYENQLINEIKSMEEIVITQADKGGMIVILDKIDYISKIEEKLNDKNTYELIKSDPTINLKKQINEIANKLCKQEKIAKAKKSELTSIGDLPNIRGQPKIHKDGAPMRIITCSRDTILSPVSRFTFNLIKDLRQSLDGVVRNTSSFVQEVTNLPLDQGESLASIDIQDLFLNIPLATAIDITIEKLVKSKKLNNTVKKIALIPNPQKRFRRFQKASRDV